jgi:hypothetical protein
MRLETKLPGFRTTNRCGMYGSAVRALAGIAFLLLHTVTIASSLDDDFDDETKPWEEIAVQLPPAPKQEDLATFDVGPLATYTFAVDTKSVSVGSDGVVRYTLVATSTGGARNVSYEGIRCASYERKLYAFGRPDGTWSRSRRDQWERIASYGANPQHAVLFKDFFCDGNTIAKSQEGIVRQLKSGRGATAQNAN